MLDTKVKEAIESAVTKGSFGDNSRLVEFVPSNKEGEDQFASDVIFAHVKLECGTEKKDVSVVIKRQQNVAFFREMQHSNEQFYNEHLMYSEILPFIEKNNVVKDIYPKWFHSVATLGENFEEDIVVVEDLKSLGYVLAKEKIFLDFDHCVLALRSLGRFHALSYAMKEENKEEFLEKVKKLKEVRWGNGEDDNSRFLTICLERGISPLIEAGEGVSALKKFQDRAQDPTKLGLDMNAAEEPMAVLCHGDFNRNNMLFRYNESGKPDAVKIFDIATSRYASPVVDLSFFLFMNTTAELRADHWDDLLQTYHDALSSAVAGCRVPSLEDFRAELRLRGVYGYMISSFFIPMMLDPAAKEQMEQFAALTPEQMEDMARTKGGEPVTKILVDILKDIVKLGGP